MPYGPAVYVWYARITPAERVSFHTLFVRFLTIGAVSFGGGIVAYLQSMLVEQTKWLTADEFLADLEISQTMPGLNAVNMSILVGDRLRGAAGSLVAAAGMILPGAVFLLVIGVAATDARHSFPAARGALLGIAAGAVGLLSAITWKTGKRQFLRPLDLILLLATFTAMTILKWPLYVVLFTLGPIAVFLHRPPRSAPGA